jgi:hypothetical protein
MTTFESSQNPYSFYPDVSLFRSSKFGGIEVLELEDPSHQDVGNNTVDLVSNRVKLILKIYEGLFHAMFDTLGIALHEAKKNPEILIVLDSSDVDVYSDTSIKDFVIGMLDDSNVPYVIANLKKEQLLSNNTTILNDSGYGVSRFLSLAEAIRSDKKFSIEPPERMVYLSRSRTNTQAAWKRPDIKSNTVSGKLSGGMRMPNEEVLENYFRSLGYEIVYSEELKKDKSLIEYFSSVKILAGVSGSGLSNVIFMQPGSTLLEVTTPIGSLGPDGHWSFSIHNFYKEIAFCNGMAHISLGSIANPEDVIDIIDKNNKLRSLISND